MGYRGRLIFPQLVDVYRLDRATVAASSGYDSIYQEPVLISSADRAGTVKRVEFAAVRLPAQIEVTVSDRTQMAMTGNVKKGRMAFVFHFADLESAGLIHATTGAPLVMANDRIGAVYDPGGNLIQSFPNPPGMFVVEPQVNFGLDFRRNLLIALCESRDGAGPG